MKAIDIFIGYAEQDKDLMERFRKQLSAAERIGLVDAWHDGEIEIGTDKAVAAKKAMEEAEIIVLLLSADFFASEYLYEVEMKRALELSNIGQATLVPVLLKECTWQLTPLANTQLLPKNNTPVTSEHWKHPDRAFKQVVDELIRISNHIRKEGGDPTVPYRPERKEDLSKEEDSKNNTSLSKTVIYAFAGLLAFALVSFLINNVLSNPKPTDPVNEEVPIDPSAELSQEEPVRQIPESQTSNEQATPPQTPVNREQNQKEEITTSQDIPQEEPVKKDIVEKEEIPPSYDQQEQPINTKALPFQTINLAGIVWSANDLNIEVSGTWCPNGQAANCNKEGRLYDYKSAIQICPSGWRLPTSAEWQSLSQADIAKLKLNKSGFYYRNAFMYYGKKGFYQTGEYSGSDEVWVLEYSSNDKPLYRNGRYSFSGMSCRCVKE